MFCCLVHWCLFYYYLLFFPKNSWPLQSQLLKNPDLHVLKFLSLSPKVLLWALTQAKSSYLRNCCYPFTILPCYSPITIFSVPYDSHTRFQTRLQFIQTHIKDGFLSGPFSEWTGNWCQAKSPKAYLLLLLQGTHSASLLLTSFHRTKIFKLCGKSGWNYWMHSKDARLSQIDRLCTKLWYAIFLRKTNKNISRLFLQIGRKYLSSGYSISE